MKWQGTTIAGIVSALLTLTVVVVPPVFCAQAEWLLLDENNGSSFFIDKHNNEKPKPGVVRVTTRVVYTSEGKAEALKTLASSMSLRGLYESRYRYDIKCEDQESKLLEVAHLDEKGATLKSTDLSAFTEWEDIPPEARLALVAEVACK